MASRQWERVGAAVQAARTPRWPRRADFAKAAGLSLSTISHIEHGVDKDYGRATRDKIERALHWAPGDIERIAEGGEPTQEPDLQHVIDCWWQLDVQVRAVIVGIVDDALSV